MDETQKLELCTDDEIAEMKTTRWKIPVECLEAVPNVPSATTKIRVLDVADEPRRLTLAAVCTCVIAASAALAFLLS